MAKPPTNSAEQFVLGSVLLNADLWVQVSGMLSHADYAEERHRRIHLRMKDIADRGEKIDRVTLSNELMRAGQLESVGGFSYIVSLDEGLPAISNIDGWIRIVRDARDLRSLHVIGQYLEQQAEAKIAPLDLITDVQGKLQEIERGSLVLDNVASVGDVIDGLGGPFQILTPPASSASIPTGWTRYDALTTGLVPGDLTIFAGRPSSGKSAVMMCLLQNIAENGVPVAVFSMEMNKKSLLDRMICVKGKIDFTRYRYRKLSPIEQDDAREAMHHLYDLPMYIDDKSSHTIGDLARKIDRLVNKHGVRVVALDFAQLLTSGARQKGDRRSTTEILGEAVESLKAIAKRLNISFVLLSQLSRENEKRSGDHRPILSDLRDSGALEQIADVVVFVYREIMYKPEQLHLANQMDLIVAKQRNGPRKTIPMRFDGDTAGAVEDV